MAPVMASIVVRPGHAAAARALPADLAGKLAAPPGDLHLRRGRRRVSLVPPFVAPALFDDAASALARVREIYEASVDHLRVALQSFVNGTAPAGRVRAYYPYVRIRIDTLARADSRLSYGFVAGPGVYETTLTRPDLFDSYYLEQFRLLMDNHSVSLEVGTSKQAIPVHFSLPEDEYIEDDDARGAAPALMRDRSTSPISTPWMTALPTEHVEPEPGLPRPLALFTAPRVDYSLHRLRHYTGTAPDHFQNFVLFTNYQFYIDEFVRLGHALMAERIEEAMRTRPSSSRATW